MTAPRPIDFTVHADERGSLAAFECNTNLPFDLRRAYYIYQVSPGAERGGHAHKTCHQVLAAVSGAVTVRAEGVLYSLSSPSQGLYVPPGVRVDLLDFSPSCVLLVLASEYYDKDDYVYESDPK